MKINVHMLAFSDDEIRPVDIPDTEVYTSENDLEQTLDAVFAWGQNDFQPQQCPSVSVGDVIDYRDRKFMVMPIGFKEMSAAEFEEYQQKPREERDRVAYGL